MFSSRRKWRPVLLSVLSSPPFHPSLQEAEASSLPLLSSGSVSSCLDSYPSVVSCPGAFYLIKKSSLNVLYFIQFVQIYSKLISSLLLTAQGWGGPVIQVCEVGWEGEGGIIKGVVFVMIVNNLCFSHEKCLNTNGFPGWGLSAGRSVREWVKLQDLFSQVGSENNYVVFRGVGKPQSVSQSARLWGLQ